MKLINHKKLFIFVLILLLFLVVVLSLFQGYVEINKTDIIKSFLNKFGYTSINDYPDYLEPIIFYVRIPRILLGMFIGAALAVSGCALQGIFRNVMAGPYTTGIASGASFGAALVISAGLSANLLILSSFSFALLTAVLVYSLAVTKNILARETLLLAGIVVSIFFSALVSFIQYMLSDPNLREIIFWLMGGLWKSDWNLFLYTAPIIFVATPVIFFFHRELNALLLSDEEAKSLGLNLKTVRLTILLLASLITAAAVSAAGIIGFVGLICPHIVRLLIGSDYKYLLPASALTGAITLIIMDTLSRSLIYPVEIPVGIISSLIGVPFFIFLLKRKKVSI